MGLWRADRRAERKVDSTVWRRAGSWAALKGWK